MLNNVRIIATIGPSSLDPLIIKKMEQSGVDIIRINLSHTNECDIEQRIKFLIKNTSKTICIDSEGAQLRTGIFIDGQIELATHSSVKLVGPGIHGDKQTIPLNIEEPFSVLSLGDVLRIDFNAVIIQITRIEHQSMVARVLRGGTVGSNKGISTERELSLPPFSKKDLTAFQIAQNLGVRTVAFSFASSAKDIMELRKIFNDDVTIISKIESRSAMHNLEEVCYHSDAILIDRGDLSRDVPIEKIAFAQRYILSVAKTRNTIVYVATNLLESMVTNPLPTRAEVHDITETLLSGVRGLVLAAETAIGKYPVECTRFIRKMIEEVSVYQCAKENLSDMFSPTSAQLISPHGGELHTNYNCDFDRAESEKLPFLLVDDHTLTDFVQICDGVYSPVISFMCRDELYNVLNNYQLRNGICWTLPIIFQVSVKEIRNIPPKGLIAIKRKVDGICYALLEISEIRKMSSQDEIAEKWFGTVDTRHPGVKMFMSGGEYTIAGVPSLLRRPCFVDRQYDFTPAQTRKIFEDCGWQTIVGFHTRNVIHRGHEFIQRSALKTVSADALFISPLIGKKEKGDFSANAIISSYEVMLKNGLYNPFGVLLCTFNTYPRYSGPREAVFTALCRKNYGCSHFVMGGDHTGVGNYYAPDASQRLFDRLEIGINILRFDSAYHCKECSTIKTDCLHTEGRESIRGSLVRECISRGEQVPEYLMRPEVSEVILSMYRKEPASVFEI